LAPRARRSSQPVITRDRLGQGSAGVGVMGSVSLAETGRRARIRGTRWLACTGRQWICGFDFSNSKRRHCEERKRRSNPAFFAAAKLDCFASLATTWRNTRCLIPAARFHPGFAMSLSLSYRRGHRESRAPTAPAAPCAKSALTTHTG